MDLLTFRGVEARYPEEAARRRWLGKFYHRPAGGESWADLTLRVRSFLNDLDRLENGRVLMVCHDVLVLMFRYECERLSEQQVLEISASTPVKNVSVTRLLRDPGGKGWTLGSFNDVSHLETEDAPITEHPGSEVTTHADTSDSTEFVTASLLRSWPLPAVGDSKYGRGQVLVLGGAAGTPGAALLAGLAVLRVGAGHLTFGVAQSAAVAWRSGRRSPVLSACRRQERFRPRPRPHRAGRQPRRRRRDPGRSGSGRRG